MAIAQGVKIFGAFIPTQPPPPEPEPEPEPEPVPMAIAQLGIKLFGTFIHTQPQQPQQEPEPNLEHILDSLGVPRNQNPTRFFSKTLFKSDVEKGLNRLTIPRNLILEPFLTDEEELRLREGGKLAVKVIEPSLGVKDLSLSRWNYKKAVSRSRESGPPGYSYALNGGWMDIVKANGLEPGDGVEVKAFRFGQESGLGFIISKKAGSDGPGSGSGGNGGVGCSSWGMKKRRGSTSYGST